jgi:group I intron endonuclease
MINLSHKDYKKVSGIYIIKNLINNKVYIGRAVSMYDRVIQHKKSLERNNHPNDYLQKSYNKYKEENFIVIPNIYPRELLMEKEEEYIIKYKSDNSLYGYNLQSYLNGAVTISQSTKDKLSKTNKGRIPVAAIARLKELTLLGLNPMKGRIHSEETKKKMSLSKQGYVPVKAHEKTRQMILDGNSPYKSRPASEETKAKLKEIRANWSEEKKKNIVRKRQETKKIRGVKAFSKSCYIMDLDNNIIEEFSSVRKLIEKYSIFDYQTVRRICSGYRKNQIYQNYKFKYK